MIEKLTRVSSGDACCPVCRIDFDIWHKVLSRFPGARLESLSRADDRRDADIMFAKEDAKNDADLVGRRR